MKFRLLIVFTFLFINTSYGDVPDCIELKKVNISDECYLHVKKLHPTQFVVGMYAVNQKIAKIEEKYVTGKLKKYLKQKTIPVVLGPNKRFYLSDGHHSSLAILKSKIPDNRKKVIIKLVQDWSEESIESFEKRMQNAGYCYLDITGKASFPFAKLPKYLNKLKDDPYRSLSLLVRDEEGYNKVDVNFLEFIWADYFFSQGIRINSSLKDLKNSLEEALILSKSEKARELPGYITNTK